MLSKKLLPALLLLGCVSIGFSMVEANRCPSDESSATDDVVDKECTETEYRTYVECIRKRTKRYTDCASSSICDGGGDCDDNCGECDCNYCSYNDCDNKCQSCCDNYSPPCSSRSCCQQTCHATCKTSHCRRSCRSRCNQSVANKETIIHTSGGGSGGGSSSFKTDSNVNIQNQAKHNITTVINLHNVVNNTNVVDMPVVVNNTNFNNITLESPGQGAINVDVHNPVPPSYPPPPLSPPGPPGPPGQPPPPPPVQPNCCNLISPRQCMPIQEPPYTRCYHTRSKVCGEVCQSPIMHAEPHRVCEQNVNLQQAQTQCHEQVAYIPQPQPRCFSTSQWPYVQCTVARANCAGCYKHIVQGGSKASECSNACYEGGMDVGPIYRPGPYYQPSYYMPQSCGSGGCTGMNAMYSMGVGGMPTGAMGPTGPMSPINSPYIESIGSSFDYGGRDLTPRDEHLSSDTEMFMKSKRSSDEGAKEHSTMEHHHDGSEPQYTVEELPIKLTHL